MTNANDVPNVILDGSLTVTSTTTSTTAGKLVDTAVNFTTLGVAVGDLIVNTTSNTETKVTAIDSTTILSVADNIMVSGDGYKLYSGTNIIRIYTENVEEVFAKKLEKIPALQSSNNWSLGPKTVKFVDLLRIERRFTVRGLIDDADKTKFRNINDAGGVFNFIWDGSDYVINIEKYQMTKSNKNEADDRGLTFTGIVGGDM